MPKSQLDDMSLRVPKVLNEFGTPPLAGTPLAKEGPLSPTPETVLAMIMDAMIKSRPISHELAQQTVRHLIEGGYHDINKLYNSTWEERTDVLREGGYNRYREQGATNLGALAEFVQENYDGDLNNLLEEAQGQRSKVMTLIKEIKGVGDLAGEIFLDNVQSVWPSMAPFIDSRSLKTAKEIGIGTDVEAICEALNRDPVQMSWFANGLSNVRLEHREQAIESV